MAAPTHPDVKKALANTEPSTHGTKLDVRPTVAVGGKVFGTVTHPMMRRCPTTCVH